MGGVEGYLLVIALIYTVFNKTLAIRASVVLMFTMVVNHLLKSIIQNPRPFTVDGIHQEMWAVSSSRAAELAAEFSTPSGHAMAAAAFYAYLVTQVESVLARIVMIGAIVLIGLSRPFLGVHYVEDILLGWVLGVAFAVFSSYWLDTLWRFWCSMNLAARLAIVATFSFFVWLATLLITNMQASELPTEFVSVLGFLSAVLVVVPIEADKIGYQTAQSGVTKKWLGFGAMIGILAASLFGLGSITVEPGICETVWRYLRYSLIGSIGMLCVPWLLVKFQRSQPTL